MTFQGTSGDLILVSNCVPYAGLAPHISSLMSTETLGSLFMHLKIHRKKTVCTHSIQHPACANCYLYNLSVKRKNSLKFIMSLKVCSEIRTLIAYIVSN